MTSRKSPNGLDESRGCAGNVGNHGINTDGTTSNTIIELLTSSYSDGYLGKDFDHEMSEPSTNFFFDEKFTIPEGALACRVRHGDRTLEGSFDITDIPNHTQDTIEGIKHNTAIGKRQFMIPESEFSKLGLNNGDILTVEFYDSSTEKLSSQDFVFQASILTPR